MKLNLPNDSKVFIGHTRMTTQGKESYNPNNHPFYGKAGNTKFALIHNGVIFNDDVLRMKHRLSKSKIETDSYAAVQLIEQQKQLSFASLAYMAEEVNGMFAFVILDNQNNTWIVKGDNPVCIYKSVEYGFYVYTSTEEILTASLKSLGLDKLTYERVPMAEGDILKINEKGIVEKGRFTFDYDCHFGYHRYSRLSCYDRFGGNSYHDRFNSNDWVISDNESMSVRQLKQNALLFGVDDEDINILLDFGYCSDDIELMLNNPNELHRAVCEAYEYVYCGME
jgi:hypothetical protein